MSKSVGIEGQGCRRHQASRGLRRQGDETTASASPVEGTTPSGRLKRTGEHRRCPNPRLRSAGRRPVNRRQASLRRVGGPRNLRTGRISSALHRPFPQDVRIAANRVVRVLTLATTCTSTARGHSGTLGGSGAASSVRRWMPVGAGSSRPKSRGFAPAP
jgi:hypothetical protein